MPPSRVIDALLPLQEIDLAIHRLRSQRAELPRALAGAEEKLARARSNREAVASEIKALRLDGQKRESSVKEFDEKINKLIVQANQARKNDEYQALQKEISGHKAEKARVEESLLDVLYQIDEKGKLDKVRDDEVKTAEADHSAAKKKVEGEIAELDKQIAGILGKRSGMTGAVDRDTLKRYERILAAKEDGLAIAPVGKYDVFEDEGRATYWQCEGCNCGLTSQDVNLLIMGKDVFCCRNCSRILFVRPT